MTETARYKVKVECKNCGWVGRALIRNRMTLSQTCCPECECAAVLRRRTFIAPWHYVSVPRDAFYR